MDDQIFILQLKLEFMYSWIHLCQLIFTIILHLFVLFYLRMQIFNIYC